MTRRHDCGVARRRDHRTGRPHRGAHCLVFVLAVVVAAGEVVMVEEVEEAMMMMMRPSQDCSRLILLAVDPGKRHGTRGKVEGVRVTVTGAA